MPPPLAVFTQKSTGAAAAQPPDNVRTERTYSIERETSPLDLQLGTAALELSDSFDNHFYANDPARNSLDEQRRSVNDLSQYARMSGDGPASVPQSYVDAGEVDRPYSYPRNPNLFPSPIGEMPSPPLLQNGTNINMVKTSSIPTLLDAGAGASEAARKNSSKFSSPSLRLKSLKTKLVKTSSTPTVLDDNSGGSVQRHASRSNRDDYVPASPSSAAISPKSDSGLGAAGGVSDLESPSTPNSSGAQSPAVVSLVAGVSMSKRSRVFTRQK